jgi:hypothetical protein
MADKYLRWPEVIDLMHQQDAHLFGGSGPGDPGNQLRKPDGTHLAWVHGNSFSSLWSKAFIKDAGHTLRCRWFEREYVLSEPGKLYAEKRKIRTEVGS